MPDYTKLKEFKDKTTYYILYYYFFGQNNKGKNCFHDAIRDLGKGNNTNGPYGSKGNDEMSKWFKGTQSRYADPEMAPFLFKSKDFFDNSIENVQKFYDDIANQFVPLLENEELKTFEDCKTYIKRFIKWRRINQEDEASASQTKTRPSISHIRSAGSFSYKELSREFSKVKIEEELLSYVKPDDEENFVKIMEVLSDSNAEKHILLYGRGGYGKTTALQKLMQDTYGDKNSKKDNSIIMIKLRGAPNADTNNRIYIGDESTFIRRKLFRCLAEDNKIFSTEANEYLDVSYGKLDKEIKEILNKFGDKMTIILDGIDEITGNYIGNHTVKDMVKKEIAHIMSEFSKIKVIMTSRSTEKFVLPQNLDLEEPIVKCYAVCGLNKNDVVRILKEKGETAKAERVAKNEKLTKLLHSPFLFSLFLKINKDDNSWDINTAGELMFAYYEYEKNRAMEITEAAGHEGSLSGLQRKFVLDVVLPALAVHMKKESLNYIDADDFPEWLNDYIRKNHFDIEHICGFFGNYVFDYVPEKIAHTIVSNNSLTDDIIPFCENIGVLRQDEIGNIRFRHGNILDYFYAYYYFSYVRLSAKAMSKERNDIAYRIISDKFAEPLDNETIRLLSEILGEYRNTPRYTKTNGWKLGYDESPDGRRESQLYAEELLKLFRGKEICENDYSLYNIVEILKTRGDLSGVDFSGLDLTSIRLNGFVLGRPGLLAKFDGATLSHETLLDPVDEITAVAFTSNEEGEYLAANESGLIKICDSPDSRNPSDKKLFYSKNGIVLNIVCNPQNSNFAVFSSRESTALYSLNKKEMLKILESSPKTENRVSAFNNNGLFIAASFFDGVILWKFENNDYKKYKKLDFNGLCPENILFHPSKNQLILTKEKLLRIWNLDSFEYIDKTMEEPITAITFSSDKLYVVTGKFLYALDSDSFSIISTPINLPEKKRKIVSFHSRLFLFGDQIHEIKNQKIEEGVVSKGASGLRIATNGKYFLLKTKDVTIYYYIYHGKLHLESLFSSIIHSANFHNIKKEFLLAADDCLQIWSSTNESGSAWRCTKTFFEGKKVMNGFYKNEKVIAKLSTDEYFICDYSSGSIEKLDNGKNDDVLEPDECDTNVYSKYAESLINSEEEKWKKLSNVEFSDLCFEDKEIDFVPIGQIAYNSSKRMIAFSGIVRSMDRWVVKIFDIVSGELYERKKIIMRDVTKSINSLSFNYNDDILIAQRDGLVEIYTLEKEEPITVMDYIPGMFFNGVNFSKSNTELLSETDKNTVQTYGAII